MSAHVPFRLILAAVALVLGSTAASANCNAHGWKIAFEGDSLTYGQDTTSEGGKLPAINGAGQTRSERPFPEEVARLLAGAEVQNRGFPGDRTIEALERWAEARPSDITVIMYGTNDAANFGGFESGPLTVDDFRQNLTALVERRKKQGAKVILLTPTPIQDPAFDERIKPYRAAVSAVARATGAKVLDTSDMIASVEPKYSDGLHLSGASNLAIAKTVADLLAKSYCKSR